MTVDADFFAKMSQPCPVPEGTRIRLVAMGADPNPVPAGTLGTVVGGNGSQLWVAWDNGSRLCLIVDVDRYEQVDVDRS